MTTRRESLLITESRAMKPNFGLSLFCVLIGIWSVATAGNIVVIAEPANDGGSEGAGQVFLYSALNGTNAVRMVIEHLPHLRERPAGTYFDRGTKTLYVASTDAHLYEIDLTSLTNGYRVVYTNDMSATETAWFDEKLQRPVGLHMSKNSVSGKWISELCVAGTDGVVKVVQKDEVLFNGGYIFGIHFDRKTTTSDLIASHPALAATLASYPNQLWMIVGRSRGVTVFQKMPDKGQNGSTIVANLFLNRIHYCPV